MEFSLLQTNPSECGILCLLYLHKLFFKKYINKSKILSVEHVPEKGLSLTSLKLIGENLGIKISWFKPTFEEIIERKISNFILLIKNNNLLHYVIVVKKRKNSFYVFDPQFSEIQILKKTELNTKYAGVVGTTERTNFNLAYLNKLEFKNRLDFHDSLKLIFHYKHWILFIYIAAILVFLLTIAGGFYFQIVLNTILPNNLLTQLVTVSLLFVFLTFSKSLFSYFLAYFLSKLKVIVKNKYLKYFQHEYFLKKNSFINNIPPTIWRQRINSINELLEQEIKKIIFIPLDIIIIFFTLIIMFVLNLYLTLMAVAFGIVIVLFVNVFSNKLASKQKKLLKVINAREKTMNHILFNSATIKAKNDTKFIENKFLTNLSDENREVLEIQNINNGFSFFQSSLQGVLNILLIFVGVYFIINRTFQIGTLFFFTTMFGLFQSSASGILGYMMLIKKNKLNLNLVNDFFVAKSENVYDGIKNNINFQKVEFKNLNYQYERGINVFSNVNVSFNKNLLITGKNGKGKSTLCKLLASIYSVQNGKIVIDDININNIALFYLRNKILYLSSESHLYHDNILEIITPFLEKLNLKTKNFLFYLLSETGLEIKNQIEYNGNNLSQGQRQIVNCLGIFDPSKKILILDEAFSNIPQKLKVQLINFINKTNKILVYASHDKLESINFQEEIKL